LPACQKKGRPQAAALSDAADNEGAIQAVRSSLKSKNTTISSQLSRWSLHLMLV
jgi:hypothetical protein